LILAVIETVIGIDDRAWKVDDLRLVLWVGLLVLRDCKLPCDFDLKSVTPRCSILSKIVSGNDRELNWLAN
jgi:hypothetical protein